MDTLILILLPLFYGVIAIAIGVFVFCAVFAALNSKYGERIFLSAFLTIFCWSVGSFVIIIYCNQPNETPKQTLQRVITEIRK